MLTVLLPECAPGVQLPAPGYFGNLLTLLLVANPVFGSAGTAVAVVLNWLDSRRRAGWSTMGRHFCIWPACATAVAAR